MPVGGCGGRERCGHAYVYVEGCDVSAETHGNNVYLDVSQCGAGEHRVILVLHDDYHATWARNGTPVASFITMIVDEARNCHSDSDKDSDSDSDKDKHKCS